jgi:hypothetical protein
MGYAVGHRDSNGTLHVDDVSSLEAAVELVERLRNQEGPSDVRVFREVPIEVRTYYKVVLADEDGVASSPGTTSPGTTSPGTTSTATTSPEVAEDRVPPAPSGPVEDLPGAFPLGAPAGAAIFEGQDHTGDGSRRASRFGRGG